MESGASSSGTVEGTTPGLRVVIDDVYRRESRRVLATLIRLLGNFDLAEEALHDAFAAALTQWPNEGVPVNPRAWLVSTARFKAVDRLRREKSFEALEDTVAEVEGIADEHAAPDFDADSISDDRLRLIFTCCHPALAPDAQVALTLREVCGLTTEEIASAFFARAPAIAQRIVRAKTKIHEARISYEVPVRAQLPERLDAVLRVVYLVFNEGYSASSGASLVRADLSGEAIRLARLILELLPEPEVVGLLALMLLQESRRAARTTPDGELVVLEEQDRSTWDRKLIAEGLALVEQMSIGGHAGVYGLQAAIAAEHAKARDAQATDWDRIVKFYDALSGLHPSPVIELNRAVAIAMRDGPAAGLALINAILARGELADYYLAHAARADLYRRLGQAKEARAAYQQAITLVRQEPERRFLERRLAELEPPRA